MKRIATILLLSMGLISPSLANSDQEENFRTRVLQVVASGDLSNLGTVYFRADSPALAQVLVTNGFESMITRGVKIIRFHELFPIMEKRAREGFNIAGEKYLPALEPNGMVTIEYEKEIPGAPAGNSWIIGLNENRLYIAGFVRMTP